MTNFKQKLLFLVTLFITAFLLVNNTIPSQNEQSAEDMNDHKVYELRTYTTYDGKLDDLHDRFANHTMELFEKHGMENIGYWTPMDKENTLTYIIAHESREAAKASWEAFRNDPVWQDAYKASREDGPLVENIVSVFMTSTEFSPMK